MKKEPENNILSTFNNYTYKISIYGIEKDDYDKFIKLKSLKRINEYKFKTKYMIASSSETAINVRNLEMTSIPHTTEGNTFNNYSIELFQSKGMSLYQMMSISSALGDWGGHVRMMPFILDVSFNGVDENGGFHTNINRRRYPITFTTIDTHFDKTGATYSISAQPRGTSAISSSESLIEHQLVLRNINTTTDFFNQLETKLNESLKKAAPNGKSNIHKFVVDPIFMDKRFKKDSDETSTQRDGTLDRLYSAGESTFTIPRNTSISQVINMAFALCPEITKMLDEENVPRTTHIIEPEVIYKDYINEIGDYRLEYNWNIIGQTVTLPFRNDLSPVERERRIVKGAADEALRKIYYYTFTGRNTEVVSFDLGSNTYDHVMQQSFSALFKNPSNNIPGISTQTNDSGQPSNIQNEQQITQKARNNVYASTEPKKDRDDSDVYYLEDITRTEFLENIDYFKTKISYTTETFAGSIGGQSSDSNKENYETALRTLRYGGSSFLVATLKIKGDPYFLAPYKVGLEPTRESINFTKYNNIGVVFNYPTNNYEELNKTDNVVTGIYQVTRVSSSFMGGTFEQKLELKRVLSGIN